MREGALVASCALVLGASVIAHAHPHREHVDAHLVCTAGGHRLTDGDRRPNDHDVVCSVEAGDAVDHDRTLVPDLMLQVAQPLVALAPWSPGFSPDADYQTSKTFPAGSDRPRCAEVTFRATLTRISEADDNVIVWEQTLHVKPSCPPVKLSKPALACHETSSPHSVDCVVTVAAAPAGVALDANLRRTGPDTDHGVLDTQPLLVEDGGGLIATVSYQPDEASCHPIRVDAAITRDGGVVWTGHTSYTPGCHPANP